MFIHVHSNHPPQSIKQLPCMIEKRLSNLSSTKELFDEAAPMYEQALSRSGYNYQLQYKPSNEDADRAKKKKKTKSRKISWFNPPFNLQVKTKIGRLFLNMIDRHFKNKTDLNKLFNRQTCKLSYRTTKNMRALIESHNSKVLSKGETTLERTCNCQKSRKHLCPLQGKCLTEGLIYRAEVKDEKNSEPMVYIGQTIRPFKERFNEHKTSFTTPKKDGPKNTIKQQLEAKKTKSELAAHIWALKEAGTPFTTTWHIQKRGHAYKNGSKHCDLCAWEKTFIAIGKPTTILNSRNEVFYKCRSQRNFILDNKEKFKPKPP